MKTTGTVIGLKGEYATVSCQVRSACDGCHTKDFCISCSKKTLTVSALNGAGADIGDEVELEGPTSTLLGYAAAVFVAPVVASIAAFVLGDMLISHVAAPYIASLITLLACFGIIAAVFSSESVKKRNYHVIVKIINKDIDDESMGDIQGP